MLTPIQKSESNFVSILRNSLDRIGKYARPAFVGKAALIVATFFLCSQFAANLLAQEPSIQFASPDPQASINLNANKASNWSEGHYDVWHLEGEVVITQGNLKTASRQAIIWFDTTSTDSNQARKVLVYLEGNVQVDFGLDPTRPNSIRDQKWYGRLFTKAKINMNVVSSGTPRQKPLISKRANQALATMGNTIRPVQFTQENDTRRRGTAAQPTLVSPQTGQIIPSSNATVIPQQGSAIQPVPQTQQPVAVTPQTGPIPQAKVVFGPRGGTSFNSRTINSQTVPGEQITIGTGGVRVEVESERLQSIPQLGGQATDRVTIAADSFIAWHNEVGGRDRWEIYLEGDVVFVFGDRTVRAKRMYYDPNFQKGTILDSEMLTPIPGHQGLARLKADVIRQVDANNFQAHGAAMTTSRMGVPRYWLQSDHVAIRRETAQVGNSYFDPYSENQVQAQPKDRYFAQAGGNAVYFGGVPLFYWPTIATELTDPVFYLRSLRVGNDGDFGFQLRTAWDLYQVLGIANAPENSDWIGRLDYLSERGFAFGTDFEYQGPQFLGLPGQVDSQLQSYFVFDNGTDNLGFDRRDVPIEKSFRGHLLMRSLWRVRPGITIKSERGWISDRNFLEQYFERHWDSYKDYTTGTWLEANFGHHSFNLSTQFRTNNFFTETEDLPRFNHFMIGQSLLFDRVVWHAHSQIGFRKFRVGNPPTNPIDLAKFDPLAWESSNANGAVASTRHELDAPVQLGPVRVVPYLMGEAAFWQEDLNGNDTFRGFGQTGVRASLPMWRVDPTISSELFNVKGIAHKVSFDSEILYADASQDLTRLPLYDSLDDNAQEHFRRRLLFDAFGLAAGDDVPAQFDERLFAFRYGMQRYVSSPTTEIVDDLTQVRFGIRNRLQTKRGLPGRERIIDWMTFDINGAYFPRADRDNFGQNFGMFDYDFRWHIGDRLSILSDGFYDFFGQGLRTTSIGMMASRPGVGQTYLGIRSIEGPVSSNVIQGSVSYRMSDKWGINANSSVDFGDAGSIGSRVGFVYIGESFLWNLGVNYDASRGNTGFIFALEPRFLRSSRLLPLGGRPIGPASSEYLE